VGVNYVLALSETFLRHVTTQYRQAPNDFDLLGARGCSAFVLATSCDRLLRKTSPLNRQADD